MKRVLRFNIRLCLLGMLLLSSTPAQPQNNLEAWVRRYNSSEARSSDNARKVAVDREGNIVVAGDTDDGVTGSDFLVIKYSGAGIALWTNRYGGSAIADDRLSAVGVDQNGNVFVTGFSRDAIGAINYATLGYSPAGVPLWTNRYDGPANGEDVPRALAVDDNGNVFVTGYSGGYSLDGTISRAYATIAYSGEGTARWTNRYGGGFQDDASAVAVDRAGNVFVTGASGGNYATIAYSGAGLPLWTNSYNGPDNPLDSAAAIALDSAGNVFVTGSSYRLGAPYDEHYVTIGYSPAGAPLWTNQYNGPGNSEDFATALAVDHQGNVFVTGYSYAVPSPGSYFDYATIAYSMAGVALWTNRYSGPGDSYDRPSAIIVDNTGNVLVTGSATIAYSAAGIALWTKRYDGPANGDDVGRAVAGDKRSGNILVTGTSSSGIYADARADYITVAYAEAGAALWTNRYNGPANNADEASSVAVDRKGNVFVTGSSGGDYATIAYSSAGLPLWTNHYSGGAQETAIAIGVDNAGNVFVTGSSYRPGAPYDSHYVTIAYSPAGVPLWTNQYNPPGNYQDFATALAVDHQGNVFVTGYSGDSVSSDYATIAYSMAGVALWTNRYNGPGNGFDHPYAIVVDNTGKVLVTGSSRGDYATIAYSAAGVALWTNRYEGGGGANAIAVDHNGNVFVTGHSTGIAGDFDYLTIAYSGAGVALWTNRYNGTANTHDLANAVMVDDSGNVFVTGHSIGSGSSYDYATVAYSGTGIPLWTNRYNGPANGPDQPWLSSSPSSKCLAIGPNSEVYVIGRSDAHYGELTIYDFTTIKYVWRPQLAIQSLTAAASTVNLTLSAPANSSWNVQRASAVDGPWTNLGLSLIGTNGRGIFHDIDPPVGGAIYRATLP